MGLWTGVGGLNNMGETLLSETTLFRHGGEEDGGGCSPSVLMAGALSERSLGMPICRANLVISPACRLLAGEAGGVTSLTMDAAGDSLLGVGGRERSRISRCCDSASTLG